MSVLDLIFRREQPPTLLPECVVVGSLQIPLLMVRHPRARRYLLRLRPDGTARVTIPRGGSLGAAVEFAQRNATWLARQLERLAARPGKPAVWTLGTEILFRGERVRIAANDLDRLCFADQQVPVPADGSNLRPIIERHLRKLATLELPLRVTELATQHGLNVGRVSVRNQRTRWGSCSRRGTISLNWRLIQTPASVRDYIILHELAHTRQMNHSARFWQEVEKVCPEYRSAERWLKQHSALLKS